MRGILGGGDGVARETRKAGRAAVVGHDADSIRAYTEDWCE